MINLFGFIIFALFLVIWYLHVELTDKKNKLANIEKDVKKSDSYNSLLWEYRKISEKLNIDEWFIEEMQEGQLERDSIAKYNSKMITELVPYQKKYEEIKNFKYNYEFIFFDEKICSVTVKNRKVLNIAKKKYNELLPKIMAAVSDKNKLPEEILNIIHRTPKMTELTRITEIMHFCVNNKDFIINELGKDIILKECNKSLIQNFLI